MTGQPEADLNIGRTLGGQYRVDALLGQGGMGRVYRGVQLSVNRAVAIKLITGKPPHQPEWAERFRREAEATARLSHPNSVRLFDFGVTEAQELFIVMELLEGSDLACHLEQNGPLPLPTALLITRQILLALSEAHAHGIIHRDLKPDNVFLAHVRGGDTVAKVMDFGIAGIEQTPASRKLTLTGAVIGTPSYMSPEQAQARAMDARSDLYSVGIVLFEMLVGRPPFEAGTAVSILLAHVTQPPKRLAELGVKIRRQAAVQALLDRLLAKDPAERPASATATLEALDALTGGRTSSISLAPMPAAVSSPRVARAVTGRGTSLAVEGPVSASVADALGEHTRRRTARSIALLGLLVTAVAAVVLRFVPAPTPSGPQSHVAAAAERPNEPAAEPAPPQLYSVTIASAPSGASVLLDGAELGKTPFTFEFRRASELSLMRRGYQRQLVRVTPDSEPTLAVELVREKTSELAPRTAAVGSRGGRTDAAAEPTEAASGEQVSADGVALNRVGRNARLGVVAAPGATASAHPANSEAAQRGRAANALAAADHASASGVSVAPQATRAADARRGQSGTATVSGPLVGASAESPLAPGDDAADQDETGHSTFGPPPALARSAEGASVASNAEQGSPPSAAAPAAPLSAAAEPAPPMAAPRPWAAAPRQEAPGVDETTRSAALAATDETRHAQAYNNDYFDEPRDTAAPANDYEPVRRRHRSFGDAAHAFTHFVGRLLVGQTPQQRARRQAMLNQPLPYPNFPAARRAYDKRTIDADTYEDAIWLLRERRRSRINAEKDNLAHGTISRTTYETRVDQITAEFRGEWAGAGR